jgi:hypothetical protein
MPGREIIDDDRPQPRRSERATGGAADIAGAAGDEDR